MKLHTLKPASGSTKTNKRLGRGQGSGGSTAGRGHKGAQSRSGYHKKFGFEGGQMPLQRRLPKRGFTNIFKKEWIEVNLADLDQRFEPADNITPEVMAERGMIKKGKLSRYHGVVVLGKGKLTKALNVTANRFSQSAREKIEAAGGVATLVSPTAEAGEAKSD